jgi:hypothetical protein
MTFPFRSGYWLRRFLIGSLFTIVLVDGQEISQQALQQIQELTAEKLSRTPAQKKLDSQLHYAAMSARGRRLTPGVAALPQAFSALQSNASGNVLVDINATVTTQVLASIQAAGGAIVSSVPQYRAVRASVPLLSLETLASLGDVDSIRPADRGDHGSAPVKVSSRETQMLRARLGAAMAARALPVRKLRAGFFIRPISQGDVAHGANVVRSSYGFDGAGVKVGVLSDGVNALATLQASGNLPPVVNIIPGQGGSGNEGSAMLEIVYDLAPGAELYFATSASGQAQMASNIVALQQAGCDIILDDWTYFAEGVFQDGAISRAVNTVTSKGVLYLSDAQNSGNLDSVNSGTWEGDFADSGTTISGIPGGLEIHSFGPVNHDLLTVNSSEGFLSLKWSDPLGASSNDYDLYLLNNSLTQVVLASTNPQTGTQDPIESLGCNFCAGDQFVIVKHGAALPRALHLDTERGRLQIGTDGATFGHNAAASGVTVAAINVSQALGGQFVGGPTEKVETYSSDGPRRIFYFPDGSPITPGNVLFSTNGGIVLRKDDVTAADCAASAAPGFSPFCGTSAATPHAGAIAALIKSGFPQLSAQQVLDTMKGTALDIMAPGPDRDAGSGIVMANRAVGALAVDPALQATVMESSTVSPTEMTVDLKVSNGSNGMALNVSLNSLNFRTLNGVGTVTSDASAIPIGSIAPGQSTTVTLMLNVPVLVTRFSMTSAFTFTNGSGKVLNSSAANSVVH